MLIMKEDLRYSVTKVGDEITKVRKFMWFIRENESQNEGLLRLEYHDVFVDGLKSIRRENGRKT